MPEAVAIVKNIGIGLSYQDLGRSGWARYGVAPAGAMDKHAYSIANKLLNNAPDSTCLEITMGCVSLEFTQDTWVSLAGAAVCTQLPTWSARRVKKGETLVIQPSLHGIWSYLTVPGGFIAEKGFGSYSRHERSRIGKAIYKEKSLQAERKPDPFPHIASRSMHPSEIPDYSQAPSIRVCKSPHQIPAELTKAFFNTAWKISNQSDRTGFRLEGPELTLKRSIPSLPVLPGTIQLPPSGQPIVTLNDGPTCGGYPILGMIHPDDLHHFVQHAPGSHVHFTQT